MVVARRLVPPKTVSWLERSAVLLSLTAYAAMSLSLPLAVFPNDLLYVIACAALLGRSIAVPVRAADSLALVTAAAVPIAGAVALRDPDGVAVANRPQPTYDDLVELVEIARGAGAKVVLTDQLSADDVPISLGRTLYRVVQEGITNAQKHAAGATLNVQISGDVDRGVEVVLRNPFRPGPPAAPGAGLGLVGLAERVELAGGHLVHGREGSVFVVRASLPWSE